MTVLVLAYHSHNIAGNEYATNDHVAFASDLETITAAGARIVPLDEIVSVIHAGVDAVEGTLVGLTLDDGPIFDYADFTHPKFGPQRSILNIMRDFTARHGVKAQPRMHATSFVIASPDARRAMERSPDCGFTFLEDWLSDGWWGRAAASDMMAIGNHSWDHVHPAVDKVAIASDVRGDFSRVDKPADAEREIRQASQYINARVAGRCDMFAYPYGHVNDFLLHEYLPKRQGEHGMRAAFGTGGRAVHPGDPVWNIPRAVCGYHWTSPAGLEALLAG